jgi:hypothetical protein
MRRNQNRHIMRLTVQHTGDRFRRQAGGQLAQLCQEWGQCVREPYCDESGVGFGALLADNSMPLWSNHIGDFQKP